jgi:hypothetical protein
LQQERARRRVHVLQNEADETLPIAEVHRVVPAVDLLKDGDPPFGALRRFGVLRGAVYFAHHLLDDPVPYFRVLLVPRLSHRTGSVAYNGLPPQVTSANQSGNQKAVPSSLASWNDGGTPWTYSLA